VATSRTEIADVVGEAFDDGAATRERLLSVARGNQASTEVLAVLERLPQHRYRRLRDLWPDLPGLPVEA
jgi:hypothetical protein